MYSGPPVFFPSAARKKRCESGRRRHRRRRHRPPTIPFSADVAALRDLRKKHLSMFLIHTTRRRRARNVRISRGHASLGHTSRSITNGRKMSWHHEQLIPHPILSFGIGRKCNVLYKLWPEVPQGITWISQQRIQLSLQTINSHPQSPIVRVNGDIGYGLCCSFSFASFSISPFAITIKRHSRVDLRAAKVVEGAVSAAP